MTRLCPSVHSQGDVSMVCFRPLTRVAGIHCMQRQARTVSSVLLVVLHTTVASAPPVQLARSLALPPAHGKQLSAVLTSAQLHNALTERSPSLVSPASAQMQTANLSPHPAP